MITKLLMNITYIAVIGPVIITVKSASMLNKILLHVEEILNYLMPKGLDRTTNHRKILICSFYRPRNSSPAFLSSIEYSISAGTLRRTRRHVSAGIEIAYDTIVRNILLTGDLNLDTSNESSNKKISDIYQHYTI